MRNMYIAIIILLFTALGLYTTLQYEAKGSVQDGYIVAQNGVSNVNATIFYEVRGDTIYMINLTSGEERPIHLFGVNWFGFETPDHVVHGLWARNWEDMLVQIKSLGFNAIRLPFCTESVQPGTMPTTIDYYKNPDLQGLTSLEIMEKIIQKAGELGIFVLLDYHRIGCQYIEPLWYTDTFTEQDYINTWISVAQRFSKYWNVIGADLKNEPHSVSQPPGAYTDGAGATWGTGNNATDWNLAAERIGNAILQVAPHWLIFVEGSQYTNPATDGSYQWGYNSWWGGNLMAVRDYPVNLPRNKLVYSPHVYGPDVYNQPYFNEPDFPENMPDIWFHHFGYVKTELGYPVVIGEFGGRYGHGGDPRDVAWQNKLIDWMIDNGFCDFFYWSWNPNSGDTGGILQDDWTSIWEDKYQNLKRLMDYCSQQESYNGTIAAYYLQNLDPEKIKWHNWTVLVLEPDEANQTIMDTAENWSHTVLAYLNVGYAEEWRSYWQDIAGEPWVHGATDYEGEYYIEYWNTQWHNITKNLASQYISQGFHGVYLDNIDAAEVLDWMSPPWASGVDTYAEMIDLVCDISWHVKSIDPDAKVYINIGGAYNLLYNDTLLDCIDGVLREELWTVWSGYNQTSPQDPTETNDTLSALHNARSNGISIIVADPVKDSSEADSFCRRSWSNGFIPVPQPAWAPDYEIPPLKEWCAQPDQEPGDNASTGVFNLYVDFEGQETGVYDEVDLQEDFNDINWSRLDGRALIAEEGGNKYLRIEYPAGAYGSRNSGASFVVNLPESKYCRLDYMVRFEDGFDFSKGGKLPGLTSGGSYWTGFRVPKNGEGWSARFTWRGDRTPDWSRDYNRSDAALFLYLYWMGQQRSYGDYISLNYTVVPGVWYKITQIIYVGTAGEADAYITVYINGTLALNLSNIQLRGEGQRAFIDSFYFSTFFGGSSSSWAPTTTVYADFDEINITCIPVNETIQPGNPPTVTLTANTTSITPGEPVQLQWTVIGADGWSSNIPGIGGVPSNGSIVVTPSTTTTYYIHVWNSYGDSNATVTIQVTGGSQDSRLITIRYPDEQWPTAEIDLDEDGYNEYVIEINPWNIDSADGYAEMTFYPGNGTLHYVQALDNIVLRNPGSWVHGYPEIFYGNKPWNQYSATDGPVPLPARVTNLNNFYVTVSYSLNPEPGLPVNLAIESWLTRDQWRSAGIQPDEQEIMIWLYYDGLQPAGSKAGEIIVPIIVNGTEVNATFEVWKAFIGWEYIAFRITTPIKAGTVTLPYSPFISTAANITDLADYTSLYLEDVEVGTEYGSPSTTSAHMEWWIYQFNLTPTGDPLLTIPPPGDGSGGGSDGGSGGAVTGSIDVTLVNSWGSGAHYEATVILDQESEWSLLVKVADGYIDNSWGAVVNGTTQDGYIVLVAEQWNLGPEATAGFITRGQNPLVEEVLLVVGGQVLDNWTAPEPSSESLEVNLVIDSDWSTGFVARIYITNNGDTPVSNWYIKIYMTSTIQSIWGGTAQYLGNNTYIITPAGYTAIIDPGETVEVGFVAEKAGDHPYPEVVDYGVGQGPLSTIRTAEMKLAPLILVVLGIMYWGHNRRVDVLN